MVTPLFNVSRGSILLPVLFHFQLNNPIFPDAQPYDTVLMATLAVIVVAIYRTPMFTKQDSVTQAIPIIETQ
jgi:hypothetical protein